MSHRSAFKNRNRNIFMSEKKWHMDISDDKALLFHPLFTNTLNAVKSKTHYLVLFRDYSGRFVLD